MLAETEARPSYVFSPNPALKGYYPKWVDNLAENATLEGSMLDGVVQGAENVRSVVTTIRSLYDRQAHKFADHVGDRFFLEEYVAEVRGEALGCVVLVSYNKDGQTDRVIAGYRPRAALTNFARLLGERFAGTQIAKHFTQSTSEGR
jgi:hypothetical protein